MASRDWTAYGWRATQADSQSWHYELDLSPYLTMHLFATGRTDWVRVEWRAHAPGVGETVVWETKMPEEVVWVLTSDSDRGAVGQIGHAVIRADQIEARRAARAARRGGGA